MLSLSFISLAASSDSSSPYSTCYDIKAAYQGASCCGDDLSKETEYIISPPPPSPMSFGTNPCAGVKQFLDSYIPSTTLGGNYEEPYFQNRNCTVMDTGLVDVFEQSGANVTEGYVGLFDAIGTPITTSYLEAGLCPVNVHWHLGTEHLSVGEFDENGDGPNDPAGRRRRRRSSRRKLGGSVREGFACHYYDPDEPMYTTPYDWKYCVDMEVGQTYEVHWPHSTDGDCGTPFQYQYPFYDGVFCNTLTSKGKVNIPTVTAANTTELTTFSTVGVEGQVFTIVNNESYYYPDLIRGAIKSPTAGTVPVGDFWTDVAYYTGSTTGTSRDNEVCSRYTPITWQVDRKCHLISASSFDKMCQDMKAQQDDMSNDLYPHGARELVSDEYAANNLQRE